MASGNSQALVGFSPQNQRAKGLLNPADMGVSFGGMVLFVIGVFVFGSAVRSLRLSIGGLLLQPYLIPIVAAMPLVVASRLREFPARVLIAMIIFTSIYLFACIGDSIFRSEVARLPATMVSIIVIALLVRSRADVMMGALGLSIAVALISAKGFTSGSLDDLAESAMEGIGNKNSFSLYALPAILVTGYFVLNERGSQLIKMSKYLALLCVMTGVALIFSSGNRSGYLGVFIIGLMLFWKRKFYGLILVALAGVAMVSWMVATNRTERFLEKLDQTFHEPKMGETKHTADSERIAIWYAALHIAAEHPLLGMGPDAASVEYARYVNELNYNFIDAHNMFVHVLGSSGVVSFTSMILIGVFLWRWNHPGAAVIRTTQGGRNALWLARCMLVLLAVRGFFQTDALYSPGFCIGLGLTTGMCIVETRYAQQLARLREAKSSRPQLVARA